MQKNLNRNKGRPVMRVKASAMVSKKDQELMDRGHIRDLRKITATLNESKAQKAEENYLAGPEEMEYSVYGDENYNLKFGYMNAQICLSYLVRIEPYNTLFIMYNGRGDHPDRMVSD